MNRHVHNCIPCCGPTIDWNHICSWANRTRSDPDSSIWMRLWWRAVFGSLGGGGGPRRRTGLHGAAWHKDGAASWQHSDSTCRMHSSSRLHGAGGDVQDFVCVHPPAAIRYICYLPPHPHGAGDRGGDRGGGWACMGTLWAGDRGGGWACMGTLWAGDRGGGGLGLHGHPLGTAAGRGWRCEPGQSG